MNKLIQIFNRLAFIRENKGTKEYDNKFQNELLRAVMNSGTARNCIEKRASYIFGKGFTEQTTANEKANKKQTFNKFLADTANNVSLFKTVSWLIKVDHTGQPLSIKVLPTQKIKVKSDGSFMYNPTLFEDDFDRNLDQDYPAYDAEMLPGERLAIMSEQVKKYGYQLGFIYYTYQKSIGQSIYAIPPAYSGLEDILTDHELSAYELENLQNGFLPSAILTLIGKVDDTVQDSVTGKTEADQLKDNLKKFTAKEGGRSKLMVLTAETKEQVPNLQQMDVGKILEGMEKITDRIGRKVCRLFEVPPVLAGFEEASILGSNQTFKNALLVLQHSTQKDQELIIESLNEIYPLKDFSITELKLIDYIPQEVLAKLTDDEIRALGGYAPIEIDINQEKQDVLNNLNTLSPLVANKVLESMTSEEIRALVGLTGSKPIEKTDETTI